MKLFVMEENISACMACLLRLPLMLQYFPPPRAWIGIQFHYYLSISQFHETSPVLHLIYINIYSSNLPSWDSISDLRGFPSLLSPPPPPSPKELATGSGSHSFDEDDPWTEMKKKSSFSNHSQYWCDGE